MRQNQRDASCLGTDIESKGCCLQNKTQDTFQQQRILVLLNNMLLETHTLKLAQISSDLKRC